MFMLRATIISFLSIVRQGFSAMSTDTAEAIIFRPAGGSGGSSASGDATGSRDSLQGGRPKIGTDYYINTLIEDESCVSNLSNSTGGLTNINDVHFDGLDTATDIENQLGGDGASQSDFTFERINTTDDRSWLSSLTYDFAHKRRLHPFGKIWKSSNPGDSKNVSQRDDSNLGGEIDKSPISQSNSVQKDIIKSVSFQGQINDTTGMEFVPPPFMVSVSPAHQVSNLESQRTYDYASTESSRTGFVTYAQTRIQKRKTLLVSLVVAMFAACVLAIVVTAFGDGQVHVNEEQNSFSNTSDDLLDTMETVATVEPSSIFDRSSNQTSSEGKSLAVPATPPTQENLVATQEPSSTEINYIPSIAPSNQDELANETFTQTATGATKLANETFTQTTAGITSPSTSVAEHYSSPPLSSSTSEIAGSPDVDVTYHASSNSSTIHSKAVEDTTIFRDGPENSDNGSPYLTVEGNGKAISYLRFDISSISMDFVDGAILRLYSIVQDPERGVNDALGLSNINIDLLPFAGEWVGTPFPTTDTSYVQSFSMEDYPYEYPSNHVSVLGGLQTTHDLDVTEAFRLLGPMQNTNSTEEIDSNFMSLKVYSEDDSLGKVDFASSDWKEGFAAPELVVRVSGTRYPTTPPTSSPTVYPTTPPTISPTVHPTIPPTSSPTLHPTTLSKTSAPSAKPSTHISQSPSSEPSGSQSLLDQCFDLCDSDASNRFDRVFGFDSDWEWLDQCMQENLLDETEKKKEKRCEKDLEEAKMNARIKAERHATKCKEECDTTIALERHRSDHKMNSD